MWRRAEARLEGEEALQNRDSESLGQLTLRICSWLRATNPGGGAGRSRSRPGSGKTGWGGATPAGGAQEPRTALGPPTPPPSDALQGAASVAPRTRESRVAQLRYAAAGPRPEARRRERPANAEFGACTESSSSGAAARPTTRSTRHRTRRARLSSSLPTSLVDGENASTISLSMEVACLQINTRMYPPKMWVVRLGSGSGNHRGDERRVEAWLWDAERLNHSDPLRGHDAVIFPWSAASGAAHPCPHRRWSTAGAPSSGRNGPPFSRRAAPPPHAQDRA
jgi:hypothetical protein